MKQTIKQVCGVLLFTLLSLSGFAQKTNGEKVIITGIVIDNTGLGLPGANVLEKGTTNGVVTDADGKYTISVKKGAILSFAFIGMDRMEKTVGNEAVINVTLKEDSTTLEEVVVVGYGTQKKSHLTGATQTLPVKDIEDLPTGNIATALVGRVVGVGVSGGNTRPGKPAAINIRRSATFSKDGGTTNPLYVIDGVLQVSGDGTNDSTLFDNLDASEVESLTFLKDGAAAIYGARSANGVVIVTTKRGKKGATRFTYAGSYGIEDEAYRTKMMNAVEYANYYNIMNGPNGYNRPVNSPQYFFSPDEIEYYKTLKYDQMEDYWHASNNQKHSLNISGGTEKATFFAGASYYQQGGNLTNIDYSKWNFRSGADFNISNDFKAGIQIGGYYNDISSTNSRNGGTNEENDYRRLLNASPILPEYIQGMAVQRLNTSNESQYHFGEINRLGNVSTNNGTNLSANFYAEYKLPFVKGLSLRASYARNVSTNRADYIGTKFTTYQFENTPGAPGAGANGHIYDPNAALTSFSKITARINNNGNRIGWGNTRSESEQSNFNVNYSRDFGKHSVSGLFSIERGEAKSNKEEFYKDDPIATTNGQSSTAFGAVDGSTSGSESGSLGYVGRVNYSYDNKYLAEFLYRSDASTRFSPENYWGSFYSLSAGWVISKEDFFKSSVIDYLKVRYSVGLLGADDTKAWQWRQRFTYQIGQGIVNGNGNGTTGLKMEVTPNPDATWSSDLKTNFGVDAKFLDNRLSLTAESYYNVGTDLLMSKTANVPFTVGGSVASENYGRRDNFGYEFSVGWDDTVGKDFKYGLNVNFGWGDDRMVQGDFNPTEIMKPWVAQPGQSTDNGVWGHEYVGMLKTQADIDAYVAKYKIISVMQVLAKDLRPGSLSYADIRGPLNTTTGEFAPADGIVDDWDQVQLAKREATKYGMGSTLKLGYRNISLVAVVTASFGGGWNEVDSQTRKTMRTAINDAIDNRPSIWRDIYDPVTNPNGTMPNPYSEALNMAPTSTFWQRSSTSIELRNVNLGYALPEKYTKALGISSCRFNLTAINPFILYNPFDYKNPNGAYDVYPALATYSLGLNLSF
ncbi:TonB-linked outer membrane protein, SusC/RagA family [Flavobacterium fluvii]|uniref:TonB-linked outer membrane protein, SusC/RagA family n=1 Tax=Flavobacterium fluvii TaxID=468056 RepID=A0A1M5E623_9FLAO|nr:SusC/RagA family TonB-linked outer membrane protein [Flavobacterium fluvii]SHF74610.1 TonB-linked outer membrane protein, SusC/RagA family [Flavobacterium fluvii]